MQDYVLEREFLRVPRIAGVTGVRRHVKRYEVQPDPDRLKQYGITLSSSRPLCRRNANGSGDYLRPGADRSWSSRSLGSDRAGAGPDAADPGDERPREAAGYLRAEEARRLREIRQIVIASVNNVPVRVDQVVDGGPVLNADGTPTGRRRALMARGRGRRHQTRQGRVASAARERTPTASACSMPTARRSGMTRTTWSRASCCCARERSRCRPCATSRPRSRS